MVLPLGTFLSKLNEEAPLLVLSIIIKDVCDSCTRWGHATASFDDIICLYIATSILMKLELSPVHQLVQYV